MAKFKMAIINSENEILTTPKVIEADTIEEARERYWDLVIGFELVADEVIEDKKPKQNNKEEKHNEL